MIRNVLHPCYTAKFYVVRWRHENRFVERPTRCATSLPAIFPSPIRVGHDDRQLAPSLKVSEKQFSGGATVEIEREGDVVGVGKRGGFRVKKKGKLAVLEASTGTEKGRCAVLRDFEGVAWLLP